MLSVERLRGMRWLLLATAALPILQTTGCYPDLLGAINFELQSMVNTALINVASTVIENILGL